MHSKNYEKVYNFYREGYWSKQKVKNAVIKGWITESEYREITGEALY